MNEQGFNICPKCASPVAAPFKAHIDALGGCPEKHDTYVYGPVDRRYHWRCLTCDATSDPKGFVRRMDADIEAEAHE